MARGGLSGVVTGLVVSAVGLGIASLATGPVERDAPVETAQPANIPAGASAPEAPANAAEGAAAPDAGDVADVDMTSVEPEAAPDSSAPVEAAAPTTETPDMAAPAAAEADAPDAPDAVIEPDVAQMSPDAPETPSAPEPGPEGEPEAAAPDSPVATTAPTPPAPETPVVEAETPAPVVADSAAADDAVLAQPDAAEAPVELTMADPDQPDVAVPDMAGASAPDDAPAAPEAPPAPAVASDPASAEADSQPFETVDEPATPEVTVVTPDAAPPRDPVAGVVTGRLPSIGDEPDPVPDGADVAGPAGIEVASAAVTPALERNAISFDSVPGQPLLSILMLDMGGDRSGMADLGKLPFPATVAVDASMPDAAEAIAFYRAVGAEVVLIVPLPEGATPTDVDVSFEAYSALLSDVVAVMMDEVTGFQTLGDGALQVATNLAEDGLGLVSYPQGLNTGHKAVVKEGVHAGLIFRDLDGEGQTGVVIRRFLDNAAFRARNEDGVVVVARAKPDTVQTLLEWSLGNRAQSVTLAPVSAVLLSN